MKNIKDILKVTAFFAFLVGLALFVAKLDPKKIAEDDHMEAEAEIHQ